VPNYLVESYLARGRSGDVQELARRAREAAEALRRSGKNVTYLRSSFVPEDEVCLHWFAAPTAALVDEAARRASLDCDRIVEAIE
jgi:uncharacterized protein DUF4242